MRNICYSIPASEDVLIFDPVSLVPFLGFRTSKGKNGTLIGLICYASAKKNSFDISWRYQAETNIKFTGPRGIEAQKKSSFSTQSKNTSTCIHRFCCILYETHSVIKISWVLSSLSFYPGYHLEPKYILRYKPKFNGITSLSYRVLMYIFQLHH